MIARILAAIRAFFATPPHECIYQQPDCHKGVYCPWCERDRDWDV